MMTAIDLIEVGIKAHDLYGSHIAPGTFKIQMIDPHAEHYNYAELPEESTKWEPATDPAKLVPMNIKEVSLHRVNANIRIGYIESKNILLIQERELL